MCVSVGVAVAEMEQVSRLDAFTPCVLVLTGQWKESRDGLPVKLPGLGGVFGCEDFGRLDGAVVVV